MRLSLKKAAYADLSRVACRKSGSVLGEPEPHPNADRPSSKAETILFKTNAVLCNQRITCKPSPFYSLIWTALMQDSPYFESELRST